MSKVTHLSDVNALLRHAGVSGLQYQDFGKQPEAEPEAPAAEPAAELVPQPPQQQSVPQTPEPKSPDVFASNAPVPVAVQAPIQTPIQAAIQTPVVRVSASAPTPSGPLNSTFDRLRRKANSRRQSFSTLAALLPVRHPVRVVSSQQHLAEKTWQDIWAQLRRAASSRPHSV